MHVIARHLCKSMVVPRIFRLERVKPDIRFQAWLTRLKLVSGGALSSPAVLELLGLRLAPVAALDGLGKTFAQLIFGLLDS
jgi:hypothetical protein